jgi:hypothetical protein
MADHWIYYDADGNRVPPAQAKFRGKEVGLDSGVPALPGHDLLKRYRYVDAHAIGSSERHSFDSWPKFKAWCKDQRWSRVRD